AVSTPIAPSGVTVSAPDTGTVLVSGATSPACSSQECPTTHWAFTLCQNNTFLTGNVVYAYTSGGTANESFTSTNNGLGSGWWSGFWTSAGTDTGYCPSGSPMTAGGVWMYQY